MAALRLLALVACLLLQPAVAGLASLRRHRAANVTRALGLCQGSGPSLFFRRETYPWANKNGDASCSGASSATAPAQLGAGPAWSFKDATDSIVSTHPCIDDRKNIYLGNRNGKIRKFSSSGNLLWENADFFKHQFAQILVGGCALADGSLFVGATDGTVAAIDMETGTKRWLRQVASSCGGDSWSLAARSGIVITVGRATVRKHYPDFGGNDHVLALDARTGEELWRFAPKRDVYNFLGSLVDSPPSLAFADCNGGVYRLSLCDGSVLWRRGAPPGPEGERAEADFTTGGMAVDTANGFAYVTSNVKVNNKPQGRVTAYNLADGAMLWNRQLPMPANNAPAVGQLTAGKPNSVVVALGKNPGFPNPLAERLHIFMDGSPVAWTSKVMALDGATGEPTGWQFTPPIYRKPEAYGDHFPDHICLPDAWSNGAIGGNYTVYIGHMSGNLFALQDADGDGLLSEEKGEVSKYFGGRCYQGSPGLSHGLLAATPCDGLHTFLA